VLKFACFSPNGEPPDGKLHGLHLLGNDGVPVRGELTTRKGEIRCKPRTPDPVALSLLWPVEGFGTVQLETTRLPPRDEPYILNLELARHRLMRITLKREEWGLFDYRGMEDISEQIDQARQRFIEALQAADDPRTAARLADESLQSSLWAGERLCQFHAAVFLDRRQQGGGFASPFLGTAIAPGTPSDQLNGNLRSAFDFVCIPFVWREVQPKEQDVRFGPIDEWVKACADAKLTMRGGPLLNFGVQSVPDWMYIWENDFDTIRDYAHEHVRRCVERYANKIQTWTVASGLHADNVFSFSLEQIMEITRTAAGAVRQLAPRAQIILDLTQPWGEYFARNQRTIPPLLYADMAAQSGVSFDAFGLQFLFGINSDGYHLRDSLQISALIDKLANLGKRLHVTAVAVPSVDDAPGCGHGGQWHEPWTDEAQATWLNEFCEIALSKPYVDCVCLQTLTDHHNGAIPTGGVFREDASPKPAFETLTELRRRLQAAPKK
jgi:hypothetical protein